jgi:putative endonuclease
LGDKRSNEYYTCSDGGTGRHAGLKILFPLKECGFDSRSEYKSQSDDWLLLFTPIMFYTYILKSIKSGRYYIGHTSDIEERLERHNTGKVTATKNKGPWLVIYFETCESKAEANSRELYIKSMKSRIYIEKLIRIKKPNSISQMVELVDRPDLNPDSC